MTKKQVTVITILTVVALVLGIMVSGRFWFRLDLTKNKLYTISAVSRNLHNEIEDQVRITYYLSDKLKSISPMPGEIEDLLKEYVAYSRGKIKLAVKDPVKTNLAGTIEQIGIIPQQIQTVEQDQASLITVYTGIVIEYLDEIDTLPVVFSLESLEYDITSRIRAMVRGNSRELAVIVGDNPRRWNEDFRYLQVVLYQAGYRVRLIYPEEAITDTYQALLVLGGVETFDDTVLYQIDRYIQNGGKVFFGTKAIALEMENNMECRIMEDNGLLQMLAFYGVTVQPEIVMDRTALPMQYRTSTASGAIQYRIVRNPQWIRVQGENGNPEHPVSALFSGLDMFYVNPLILDAPEGVYAEYLFTSTEDAWSMLEPFHTNPEIPYMMEKDAQRTRGKKILGASLTGTFPSWFAGRPKPFQEEWEEFDEPGEAKPARIIVIGDNDFISASFLTAGGQQSLDFIVQISDWLSNDDDIIGIRNRDNRSGRLDRITDPGKKAAAMRNARIINIFVIPLLVILAGILYSFRRRLKARDNIEIKEGHDDV